MVWVDTELSPAGGSKDLRSSPTKIEATAPSTEHTMYCTHEAESFIHHKNVYECSLRHPDQGGYFYPITNTNHNQ